MSRIFKNVAIYLLIVLTAYFIFSQISIAPQKEDPFNNNYTAFYKALEKGEVKNITIVQGEDVRIIKGTLNNTQQFEVTGPANDEKLIELIKSKDIIFSQEQAPKTSIWTTLLTSFLPFLLLIGFMFFMLQQTQGGGSRVMQFGKSRARLHTEDKKRITFADVAGVDEVKEELEEVVEFLKYPKKYTELGAKIPKGVLLFGPPGTGKTLLARAIAGEAGVPFFSISGSDFVEMFVGVGASRVRDLFEQAKKNAPCIVFIDEIDAVGRQRGAGLGGGHDEREQTLNQLLVEMDGFSVNEGIIIIAATNRPDILDPALLRPGRFDRQVVVDIPDVRGRQEILKVHAKGKPLAADVNLDILSRRTPGFTGADLANLFNEAALLAARRNLSKVSMSELEDSIERVIAGPEKKSRTISDFEKKLVSYHEAGHGLVAALLPHTDPLHKISIIPRGRAGGYTLLLPKEDRHYMTRSHLLDQVTMLLGGRMAEKLILNEISTGAQNDLERATGIVRKMITEFGMSDELGPLTFGKKQEQVFLGRDIATDRNYSEAVAYSIDKEARRIIEGCYQKADQLLRENIDALHLIAQTLIEKETIDAEEFAELLQQAGLGKFVEDKIAAVGKENKEE
ncbi:MAG: ATP-dependent zinc metalloprotease FtsH [Clostridia bacterium]|nr:ATP-dependent zinc metalloprotease FtsH [Clostridia bacterium]MDD4146307.1 ATP-dependent zinc metalloprotease FtsH [Clostridia bacterium]MDD4666128.1 ATP-dependent zinc metalloprotease FtsH [Clostridia bacterium]